MLTRATLETAVRSWLVLAGAGGRIPNADRAVIIADQDGPRPPLPYLMVRISGYDGRVHEDERLVAGVAPPAHRTRGPRVASASVHAFGIGAEAWLVRACEQLELPPVRLQLRDAGVVVRPNGPVRNVSKLLDDKTQVRFHRDFFVDYTHETAPADRFPAVELGQVVHEDDFNGHVTTITQGM